MTYKIDFLILILENIKGNAGQCWNEAFSLELIELCTKNARQAKKYVSENFTLIPILIKI